MAQCATAMGPCILLLSVALPRYTYGSYHILQLVGFFEAVDSKVSIPCSPVRSARIPNVNDFDACNNKQLDAFSGCILDPKDLCTTARKLLRPGQRSCVLDPGRTETNGCRISDAHHVGRLQVLTSPKASRRLGHLESFCGARHLRLRNCHGNVCRWLPAQ